MEIVSKISKHFAVSRVGDSFQCVCVWGGGHEFVLVRQARVSSLRGFHEMTGGPESEISKLQMCFYPEIDFSVFFSI